MTKQFIFALLWCLFTICFLPTNTHTRSIIKTLAGFNGPNGMAVSPRGEVFVAETNENKIKMIANGTIYTIAGLYNGFSGDGGPATSALLNKPMAVRLCTNGDLLIAEYDNHIIRKIDTDGIISTVAGIGADGGFSGDGGPATLAKLAFPCDVICGNNGEFYIGFGFGFGSIPSKSSAQLSKL